MALLDFFLSRKKNTANIAKERLQIIVAERRRNDHKQPDFIEKMRTELLEVICKYIKVDASMIKLQYEQKSDDISVLELNVTLPDSDINIESSVEKIPTEKAVENEQNS